MKFNMAFVEGVLRRCTTNLISAVKRGVLTFILLGNP